MSPNPTPSAFSTQEAAIASGNRVLHPGVSDRTKRLLEALKPPDPLIRAVMKMAVCLFPTALDRDYHRSITTSSLPCCTAFLRVS
jgi:hypothetical protein